MKIAGIGNSDIGSDLSRVLTKVGQEVFAFGRHEKLMARLPAFNRR